MQNAAKEIKLSRNLKPISKNQPYIKKAFFFQFILNYETIV